MSEGEYLDSQTDQGASDAMREDSENTRMLRYHGYEPDEDLSYLSRKDWQDMWWRYRKFGGGQ